MAVPKLRPIRIDGNVAYVPLTRGLKAIIDAADAEVVGQYNWHSHFKRGQAYAATNGPRGGPKRVHLSLHRLIIDPPAGVVVDHINGDGLDNRRSNLRVATNAENGRNRRISVANKSGFKGVDFNRGRWRATIRDGSRPVFLGRFKTPEEAHDAYCKAAVKLHGDFSRFS